MMKNEVKIYKMLKSLQGDCIPMLRFSGFCDEVFVIGTDYIQGNSLEGDNAFISSVINMLKQRLALFNVEHGDLREKNIVVDELEKCWVIDFGKSTVLQ